MSHSQRQHHLILPQRDRVVDGGLDLLSHHRVIFLHKPYLRRRLQGYRPRELQIMDLFLKPVAHRRKISRFLDVLGRPCELSLLLQFSQFPTLHFLELALPGSDVHRNLFEVQLILLVKFVHQRHIFEKRVLMRLERVGDPADVALCVRVSCPHLLYLVFPLLEPSGDSFFLRLSDTSDFHR